MYLMNKYYVLYFDDTCNVLGVPYIVEKFKVYEQAEFTDNSNNNNNNHNKVPMLSETLCEDSRFTVKIKLCIYFLCFLAF